MTDEEIAKHFNITITSELSDDCIHYFYSTLTADGYDIFVSTNNLNNNIDISKNIYHYDTDMINELTSLILNNKEPNKIYVARELIDTGFYDDALQSVMDELG